MKKFNLAFTAILARLRACFSIKDKKFICSCEIGKGFKEVMKMSLSPKQEKFCIEYARTGNATDAYKRAGFTAKNDHCAGSAAFRLLKNVEVQKRLQELAKEFRRDKIADVAECQTILTRIARDEKQRGLVRVQALTTLLKAQGAFTTQINLTAVTPIVIKDDVSE